ncbi:MAG: paraquat-inducible protein A [Rhodobacterales bacterium]|nr:paraquat-inducible protein A [Rhodobacterales bacterium]MDX5498689.1 paraquat-inducible protein A [Rhodobacterales bacterium]
MSDPDQDDLIACPTCDALYRAVSVPVGARGRCRRCGTTLAAPRDKALTRIVMLAATSLVLMVAAVFFPFLQISAGGMVRQSSVLDAALAFSGGVTLPLTLAVAAFIIVLPALRLGLLIYALAPMALGWYAARHAMAAFRLADALRPWAMAEIFVIGVAVALVKVGGLATLHLGIAFWAFVLLVLVNVLNDNFMCRLTIWRTLDHRSRS